ncbi:MAG: FAD-dependent thymidylate synthase [Myxococcales bacterium]|nr:FAD-dependent thymidylate synthase [Myxococcales bacterium]
MHDTLHRGLPPQESFSSDERAALAPFVTNVDGPVFALVNMPEVVKGALFARYSRSAKSLRRLLLDEFMNDLPSPARLGTSEDGPTRAEKLYDRVFQQYGDDSVAQLGGVHLACEGVSNLLTKVLERGRLMAYLEQSTRYVPYDDKLGGRWKYHTPTELEGPLRAEYRRVLDATFDTYARWIAPLEEHYRARFPRDADTPAGAYRRTIRAKALDALRGLLPAATRSNLGMFGTGQAYETLLLRMRASEATETRAFADLMLTELRKVVPSFVARVDRADRGVAWSAYLRETEIETRSAAASMVPTVAEHDAPEVQLTDFDPEGELKVIAAALYSTSTASDQVLMDRARAMSADERRSVLRAYVGERKNRRHKPGRAFERTAYRFDVLSDYGAFRDLQRHRMMTLDWQKLGPSHGYVVADAIHEIGALDDWRRVMDGSAELYTTLASQGLSEAAPYAVPMAYRIRFYMEMNAREAMHVIELRTAPQGHAAYRRVGQRMHRLIEEVAGHRSIAAAMTFVNHDEVELERLEAEKSTELRMARNSIPAAE